MPANSTGNPKHGNSIGLNPGYIATTVVDATRPWCLEIYVTNKVIYPCLVKFIFGELGSYGFEYSIRRYSRSANLGGFEWVWQ